MLGRWEAHLFHDAARSLKCRNRITNSSLYASLHASNEVLLRQGEPLAANGRGRSIAARKVQQRRINGTARAGGVMRIGTSDRVQQKCCVLRRTRKWSDLIQRRCEGDDAVARDATIGRLHADNAGEARWLTDGAARVGADGERRMKCSHSGRRATR